jgi:hypoxia-inducible factor (prolyl hydroxylase)
VYYLNAGWSSGDGGELRIWQPVAALEKLGATESQPLADVQPLADRVILFFSDSRVPHEVLPSYAERFALTVWYYDDIERRAAQQREGGQRQVVRTATGIAGKGGQGTPCAPSAIMINEIR